MSETRAEAEALGPCRKCQKPVLIVSKREETFSGVKTYFVRRCTSGSCPSNSKDRAFAGDEV